MNDQTPSKEVRTERLQGMGCKRKRVEDVRFVQGKGNYVDDLKLPGMITATSPARPMAMRGSRRSTPPRQRRCRA
jgi:carbon-monoxide dehydrogenase large subunit